MTGPAAAWHRHATYIVAAYVAGAARRKVTVVIGHRSQPQPEREPLTCADNGSVPVEALLLQICAFCACGLS